MKFQTTIEGKVSNSGYYKDCVPSLIIIINKQYANVIPHENNTRVVVNLTIGGNSYKGGVRTTEKSKYIKICQDIFTNEGKELRLCDELHSIGIATNDTIKLNVHDDNIEIINYLAKANE